MFLSRDKVRAINQLCMSTNRASAIHLQLLNLKRLTMTRQLPINIKNSQSRIHALRDTNLEIRIQAILRYTIRGVFLQRRIPLWIIISKVIYKKTINNRCSLNKNQSMVKASCNKRKCQSCVVTILNCQKMVTKEI